MRADRYSSVAVALHWAIAILILGQIFGGLYMHNLPNSSAMKFDLYQLHKSFGLSVLLLTLVRLGWRIAHPPPALPASMVPWQRLVAKATHWVFYALMLAIPIVGLAMVSVSPKDIPTTYFGVIPVPHLGFMEMSAAAEERFMDLHKFLSFGVLGLLALHVGAAVKHTFIDRDGVMRSMTPAGAGTVLGVGGVFAAMGLGSAAYFLTAASAAPQAGSDANPAQAAVATAGVCGENTMAPNWTMTRGELRFIGEQNGDSFEGAFSNFNAAIAFDPDRLDASWIEVTVQTASAGSGDGLRDETMLAGEWFDVKDYPTAIFTACDIRAAGAGYEAAGALTIKDARNDITLPFTLEIDGANAVAAGGADLVRTDFALGEAASWLDEEGVALGVRVEFELDATRLP